MNQPDRRRALKFLAEAWQLGAPSSDWTKLTVLAIAALEREIDENRAEPAAATSN